MTREPPGGAGDGSAEVPYMSLLNLPLSSDLDRIAEQMHALAQAQLRLQGLLEAVLSITGELELPAVLRRIVRTAMDLSGARYGALGVLDEEGEFLAEFVPLGLNSQELANLSGVELPHGRGLLGHLIHHPEPLRVAEIADHPQSAGFPPGHPPMHSLLGVAISVRGRVYGNIYLCDREDGRPFDHHDEGVILALAGTAGVAIENARLYQQERAGAEHFQRLLLPRLLEVSPFEARTIYRPAASPGHLGGDWYDAVKLPDGSCSAIIGDVVGHDLNAAAAMSQIRGMLRALSFGESTSPSYALTGLDRIAHMTDERLFTTACVARFEPAGEGGWTLRWSNAGHPPPLLVLPDATTRYLDAEPGLPLGVDPDAARPDHTCALPGGSTVVFYTDGLVERRDEPLDRGLEALATTVARHAGGSLDQLRDALVADRPGDGHDDMAVLLLRTPEHP
ncbi:PP2C family protein-serine/threonine phosphatase [Streptomyces sp. BRB081]|uniref:PP2C family protein-serine/threonine phosphatase n=1 Tax=Streptomyces sp. BRB081 TaxID=2769544 RepID=UPI0018ACA377|nr:GAF domain-containing SpoIIE family protein phosphatase [Streptomyces sp. BRB081]MBL3808027.1 SpoIIE family protein phosphatase [Streptomyces sp. BRB081]